MNLRDLFKRKKKYASPYYGGQGALFNSSAMPLRKDEDREQKAPIETPKRVAEIPVQTHLHPDWEQRRFEIVKMLVAQDRRSVVLGKLRASHKTIANSARKLADAAIRELMNNPFDCHEADRAAEETDE